MRNILCNVRRPIPILIAKVWRRNLDYTKNLQAKYFTHENILIYGTRQTYMYQPVIVGTIIMYMYIIALLHVYHTWCIPISGMKLPLVCMSSDHVH